MLQKILSLTPNYWVNGLSPSETFDGGRALYEANGIDLLRYPGRLSVGYDKLEIKTSFGVSLVAQDIFDMEFQSSTSELVALGYNKTYGINSDNEISLIDSATSKGNDIENYNGIMAYTQGRQIGTYNGTTFDPDAIGGVNPLNAGALWYPLKSGADGNLYIGNKHQLAKWDGSSLTKNRLTFNTGFDIVSLESDGYYLIIGAVIGKGSYRKCYVMFWDMVADQVNRIYELTQTNNLYKLLFKDGWTYVFCGEKLFRCAFDTYPTEYIKNGGNRYVFGRQIGNIASIHNNLIIFQAKDFGDIGALGTNVDGIPELFQIPWNSGGTGSISITSIFGTNNAIYVAVNDKLYRIYSTNSKLTGVVAKTPIIDLGREWIIRKIKIRTDTLATPDSISVSMYDKSGGSALSTGTFTFSGDGAKISKVLPVDGKIVNQIQLTMTINLGDPKIKSIDVYGEPLAELY